MNRREFMKCVSYSCLAWGPVSVLTGEPMAGYSRTVTGILIDCSDTENVEAMKHSVSEWDSPETDYAEVRVKVGKVEKKFTYYEFFGRLGFDEQT